MKKTLGDLGHYLDFSKPFLITEKDVWTTICQGPLHELDRLHKIHDLSKSEHTDIAFTLPYRCIQERGFEARGDEPILAIAIEKKVTLRTQDFIKTLPDQKVNLAGEVKPSLSDSDYASLVARFQHNEIEAGNVSQTTLSRRFEGQIDEFDLSKAISIFKTLASGKGHYMAVLFADINADQPEKNRYIIGATPERHLEISGNDTIMIPIAGTLRKEDRKSFDERLEKFVHDPKEINELFQVVDEEMKIMGLICPEGGQVRGPFMREIGAVIHTEYELVGRRSDNTIDALRRTLHAPTVVGSPMESAARVIAAYEPVSRRYYGGEVGFYKEPRGQEPNGDLDTAILLRCAEIFSDGSFIVQAGGGLVRDSDPMSEAAESTAKANGLINIFIDDTENTKTYLTEKRRKEMAPALNSRNRHLSTFWITRQDAKREQILALKNLKVSIVNNEDDFAFMIGHILNSFGAVPVVIDTFDYDDEKDKGDITILGPGPGDPNDRQHKRMKKLHGIAQALRKDNHPVLGVCLGHQILALYEGLTVKRQKESTQGMQMSVRTFNMNCRLGFYNSFSPIFTDQARQRTDIRMDMDHENRIIAMQGNAFIGFQFHPESIMSENGTELLYKALVSLRYAL